MRRSRFRWIAGWSVACALILGSTGTSTAAEGYDPQRAGHPLRIIAYALHPVGVILDRLIFRPAWHLAGHEPLRTLVGRERPVETAPELEGEDESESREEVEPEAP